MLKLKYLFRKKARRLHDDSRKLLPTEWQNWFIGKEFSTDWTSKNYPSWCGALKDLRNVPVEVLEIGSWEGRSAIFFLEYLASSNITCIDTFSGGIENVADAIQSQELPFVEQRFDRNLATYGDRVRKIKGRSDVALGSILPTGKKYDLIYVDGSHERDTAMVDTLLAWQLTKAGGYLIWDDYGGGGNAPDAERVQSAIDVFLTWHSSDLILIHKGYQVIIRKK
jgi:predicted O-methyltransferase YrrM